MNKVINININGQVFYIDEEAFGVLNRYLESLKRHFSADEGGDEILADIEARIAEMLSERLKNRNEVVSMADVDAVTAAMGQPEDMDEPEAEPKSKKKYRYDYHFEPGKRMYRDPDNKIIGGVCSGISEYLGLDPVWVRLLFVAVFFGFGTGLLIYIILWVILPEAKTPSEKLEMRGERVNISNIEKTVKENIEVIKDRFDKEFKNFDSKDYKNRARHFFDGMGEGISGAVGSVFYVFGRVFSFFAAMISIFAIIVVVCIILASFGLISVTVPSIHYDFFDNGGQARAMVILFCIALGLPFVGLLIRAIRRLAGYRGRVRGVGAVFGSLWILAFAGLIFLGMMSATRFKQSFSYSVTDTLKKPAHDTLYLALRDNGTGISGFESDDDVELFHFLNHFRAAGDNNNMGRVTLDITRSDDRNISIEKTYHSRGRTMKDAHTLAESIQYSFFQNDSLISFDEGYKIPQGSPWSGQSLDLNLQVPDGTVIIMRKGLGKIIYDIDNTINMYDQDMPGHKWMMTLDGLKCLDCSFNDNDYHMNKHHKNHKHWRRSLDI